MSDALARLTAALEGRYEIERELGQGGMATVYLARDLKHNRHVALKVLKPELAAVVGAERFLAEIETTANLQHPHILPLFDSGEAAGFLFYVMPYVQGETLADRIHREKQLPVDEALGIATSVASALQHAHERGVIHRDIKPGNILLQDGQPVVADFGIALAVGGAGGARLTETGLSVGTPFYMSPEQATGDQVVGPASDTYALACVLYEMLTGEPPYPGTTAQAVLGKIIQGVPVSATAVRRSVPPNVDAAIRKALEKLPADRFTGAQAFAKALADPSYRHGAAYGAPTGGVEPWRRLAVAGWGATAVAVTSLAWLLFRPEPPSAVQRFALPFEPIANPVLVPDGSGVVVAQATDAGRGQLALRSWGDLEARPIAGTEGVLSGTAAVSPDGSEIAFTADGQLKVASLQGGGVRTLADSALCCERWAEDGYVYYSTAARNIVRVRAAGGPVEQVTRREAEGDGPQGYFQVIPGADAGIFTVWEQTGVGARIDGIRLSTGERKQLTRGAGGVVTSTGHLVFGSADGAILAAPFDPDALELTAAPVTLVEGVAVANDDPVYGLSESGTLVYMVGDGSGAGQLEFVWVTRSGEATWVEEGWTFNPGDGNAGWSLSPDGTRLAVREQTASATDIWVKELPAGPRSRLTFQASVHRKPRWAPDGRTVTYLSDQGGDFDVWSRRADGTGDASLLFDFERALAEGFWSQDGEWLVLRVGGLSGSDEGARDILGVRLGVDSAAVPLVGTREYSEESPALSPDGRWLAYTSNETGRLEVYVRPFPDVDADKVPVSRSGGFKPLWSRDGRELFFVNLDTRELMAAQVRATPRFQVMGIETLFELPATFYAGRSADFYDITPDGERFLMARLAIAGDGATPQLILVQNWFEELKERVPN